ncbi:MAG: L,D-transpeptidase family protein [Patescibacteria group bacterium]|nr:L,D-transpeptidase family protein [Patescibacteria group bacterium]MDD4304003.1 L,D-transpeptidase family protein [Patescibacteria group bacterium]MDD4695008.1 L,D-transpeptidase family protein [Patescibacteria group bacterium]
MVKNKRTFTKYIYIKFLFVITLLIIPNIIFAKSYGKLLKVEGLSSIFFVIDNKKYDFPNEEIFLSWYKNFNSVENISSDDMSKYAYSGSIKLKPGNYKSIGYIRNGTIVNHTETKGYYYIENGKKRVFTTDEVFRKNGFDYKNAITYDLSHCEEGKAINSIENLNNIFVNPITKYYDADNDDLPDFEEENIYYTDPNNFDTDGDGIPDGKEVKDKTSPRHKDKKMIEVDSDKDYLNDYWEILINTNLMNADTDGDLYLDGTEVKAGNNPLDNNPEAKLDKLIKVDIKTQNLKYYFGNTMLDSFPISSGIRGMETPSGEFKVLNKVDSKRYGGPGYNFDYPNTKWNLHFTTGKYRFYIHGAYWHNNFGHPMSHGCVNVSYENMELLYWFSQIGTKIVIK